MIKAEKAGKAALVSMKGATGDNVLEFAAICKAMLERFINAGVEKEKASFMVTTICIKVMADEIDYEEEEEVEEDDPLTEIMKALMKEGTAD